MSSEEEGGSKRLRGRKGEESSELRAVQPDLDLESAFKPSEKKNLRSDFKIITLFKSLRGCPNSPASSKSALQGRVEIVLARGPFFWTRLISDFLCLGTMPEPHA